MEISKLLPIGSIVLLRDGEKRLMICGILQSDAGNESKQYDYLGVLYPEGHIGDQLQYLFYQDDIEKVIFRGYEDKERTEFLDKLQSLYEQQ